MLNNRHRTPEQREAIRELFYEKADIPEGQQHLPYQTKVDIFEKKCSGCPFAYLHVTEPINKATGELEMSYEFHDFPSFNNFLLRFSFATNLIPERGCLFGIEPIFDSVTRPQYWTVGEIVENGCEIWSPLEPVKEMLGDDFFQWYYGQQAFVRMNIYDVGFPTPLGLR